MAVHHQINGRTGADRQFLGCGEPRIDLDDLEPAIPQVALELNVSKTPEAGLPEERQALAEAVSGIQSVVW